MHYYVEEPIISLERLNVVVSLVQVNYTVTMVLYYIYNISTTLSVIEFSIELKSSVPYS